MLQRLSMTFVQFFLSEGIIKEDDQDVYLYGMEMLLSQVLIYGCSILIALIWKCVIAAIAYYGGFLLLRHSAGGYHARTHKGCALLTMMTYLAAMLITIYLPQEWRQASVIVMAVIALGSIYGFAPVDHVNKPFSQEEKKRYRYQSLLVVNVISFVCLLFMFGANEMEWTMAAMLGVFNASISVVIGSEVRKRNVEKVNDLLC